MTMSFSSEGVIDSNPITSSTNSTITEQNAKTIITGTLASTFRQCIVEPILNQTTPTHSIHNPHLIGVLPTFITATILGGSINGFLRGRHTILRSSITTSLVCSSIHIIMNEINLLRIRLLSSNSSSQTDWSTNSNISKTDENSSRDRSRFWERWIPLQRIPDEVWRKRLSEDLDFIESRRRLVSEEIVLIENALKAKENTKS
ncbi:uncharacterized protein MELLADRAFT_113431 [Melampsora larici-populina 98AG31]|uniref:Uncharacterized protein n=1 Tax=Melampsora larici-populina (strain 98AG31 / pathotype 3-4-7) TaxID=747676 RepID=F4S9V0_MELLP|nr:uncharacterized protein MELLADRAFT_113431 [Melampsora larici-populina 98AG31]EGF98581.1 hypothetical protein MELLADRAFT_113431 [Melampsora larici-populina 98AG31]